MTKTRSALLASTAIVAVLMLAACQNKPREIPGTPVQPQAEAATPTGAASGSTGTPATVPGAVVGPQVNWRTGMEGNVVWVEIIDPESYYRVDQVNLIAPDGQAFPSRDVNRTQARGDSGYGGSGPTVGLGVGSWSGGGWDGGGTSTGLGISLPLGGAGGGGASQDNGTHTVARFQLADPDNYSRTVANWMVHVRLIDNNGHSSVARFPAPATVRY